MSIADLVEASGVIWGAHELTPLNVRRIVVVAADVAADVDVVVVVVVAVVTVSVFVWR